MGNQLKINCKKLKRDVVAQRKLTNKTVVKIVMAVGEFGLGSIVFVVAMLFRKLLHQMLIGVHGLKRYCEQ